MHEFNKNALYTLYASLKFAFGIYVGMLKSHFAGI